MLPFSLPQPRKLSEVAEAIGGRLEGDGDFVVTAVAHPALAAGPDTLALAMDEGSAQALQITKSRVAVLSGEAEADTSALAGTIHVDRMRVALAKLIDLFPRPARIAPGVHASAVVDPTAELAEDVAVGPLAVIGPDVRVGAGTAIHAHCTVGADSVIGEGCVLHAGVRIGDRSVIGNGCSLLSGAVIGGEGFSYVTPDLSSVELARQQGRAAEITEARNTEIHRVQSIGNVMLGDNVDVGANSCIDRGTLGPTRIGSGTRIDNLVQVAHNCTIGENCLIAGMVGIAGSVKLGDRVVLAGGVGVSDHISIGDDSIILGGSGVAMSVPEKQIWGGYPARPKEEAAELFIATSRLPRLVDDVRALKREVSQLKNEG